jgi:hypothetical protein
MSIESKSITVAPSEEQQVIRKHEQFGWILKSSQEIYNKDSHLESRFSGLYNVTTTKNYVKLVFQRDTEMPQRDRIQSLENQYWQLYQNTRYTPTKNKKYTLFPIILSLIFLFEGIYALFIPDTDIFWAGGSNASSILERIQMLLVCLVISAVFFGIFYVYKRFIFAPKMKAYYSSCEKKKELEKEILTIRSI